MSGAYGWNIQEFIENEGEIIKMPTPWEPEEEPQEEYPKRVIKCCCCFGCNDESEKNDVIAVHTPGTFVVNEKAYYWCANTNEIPAQAVKAGIDKDGGDIYVGRATHEGELQPAKIVPNHGCAYISFDGEEIRKDEYEILCRGQCNVIWQECQDGLVPENAVPVGFTSGNEKLYIGRVFHDGTQTPGKIQPSHGSCYIAYGGEEISYPTYEALILE